MKLTEFFREELDREVDIDRGELGAKVPAIYGPSPDDNSF